MKRIKGEIVYIDLEGGFWGIQTAEANYFPLHMHEQLKTKGKTISCTVEVNHDIMTMQNWGIPCKIITFTTF